MTPILMRHCASGKADTNYLTPTYIRDLDTWLAGVSPKQYPAICLDSPLGKLFANGAAQFTSVVRDGEWASDLACMLQPHLATFAEPAVYMGGFMSAAGYDKPATIARECGRTCEWLVDAGVKTVVQDALGYYKNYEQPIAKTCCDIAAACGLNVVSEALWPLAGPSWLKALPCLMRSEWLDGKKASDYASLRGAMIIWDGQPKTHPFLMNRTLYTTQDLTHKDDPEGFIKSKADQCRSFVTWCAVKNARPVLSSDWCASPHEAGPLAMARLLAA